MSRIQTASGRQFDSDYFVELKSASLLFLRVLNVDLETVKSVFNNHDETSCLTYYGKPTFGYIYLKSISQEGDAFKVVLSKHE